VLYDSKKIVPELSPKGGNEVEDLQFSCISQTLKNGGGYSAY